ncbi:Uncharacterised protein [Chryseobacterium taklimakanense]|uniref:Uncharacterized protein n=1 Tax=Chryseobacterium taklimakanense TaxID=536441 RepID=A0A239WQV8_9FLAO|nr:Uncharacterised protein [Chryseobacterium taklimakanense]SNV36488.1 Uncharacterised protein [Chryseobacterium taklimakanense]SNV36985.1 Uncharacterised protein [Chryseobacterium taklimakanense]
MKNNAVVEENKMWGTFCPKRLKKLSIFYLRYQNFIIILPNLTVALDV